MTLTKRIWQTLAIGSTKTRLHPTNTLNRANSFDAKRGAGTSVSFPTSEALRSRTDTAACGGGSSAASSSGGAGGGGGGPHEEFRRTRSSITHSTLKLHRRSRSDFAVRDSPGVTRTQLTELASAAAPGITVQLASADSAFEGSTPVRPSAAGVTVWPSSQAWSAERDRGASQCSRSSA